MSKQTPVTDVPVYKNEKEDNTSTPHLIAKNVRTKGITGFLKGLNPANWFSELSNITITMEELDITDSNS